MRRSEYIRSKAERDLDALREIAEALAYETLRLSRRAREARESGSVHVSLIDKPTYSALRFNA